ncbi:MULTISPECIES: hypothetical protein [unclassified Nostoc]|uniref:hypothetical protein n=1 Tax=unclassified Nostoc TaxID=2593658 RepID=UPI001674F2FD|nr:hypothetical protein [Nostoc sp. 'Peltigera membranacea cyanobiont' 232]
MKNLAEKCYQSVREVLQKSGNVVPCWQNTSEVFRLKFEAELLDGIKKLLE